MAGARRFHRHVVAVRATCYPLGGWMLGAILAVGLCLCACEDTGMHTDSSSESLRSVVEAAEAELAARANEPDTRALRALFFACGGVNWRRRTHWLVGFPCAQKWEGVKCDYQTGQYRVVSLDLSNVGLRCTSLEALSKLTGLSYLRLDNNPLGSTLPSLSHLNKLRILSIQNASLSGSIQWMGDLDELRVTRLGYNNLSSELPDFTKLTNLEEMRVQNNALSGTVAPSVGVLQHLRVLDVSDNKLFGGLPGVSSPVLQRVNCSFNQFSGTLPVSYSHLYNIVDLCLSGNLLKGGIPEQWGALNKLKKLFVDSNDLSGILPATMEQLLELSELRVTGNPSLSAMFPLSMVSRKIKVDTSSYCFYAGRIEHKQVRSGKLEKDRTLCFLFESEDSAEWDGGSVSARLSSESGSVELLASPRVPQFEAIETRRGLSSSGGLLFSAKHAEIVLSANDLKKSSTWFLALRNANKLYGTATYSLSLTAKSMEIEGSRTARLGSSSEL